MKKALIYTIVTLLLAGSAPWFLRDAAKQTLAGFPLWAVCSLCFSIAGSVAVILLFQYFWPLLAGDKEGTE